MEVLPLSLGTKSYGVTIPMKFTSLAVVLHSTICFSIFSKMKFGIFFEF